MKYTARVLETIVVEKTVEIEVPEGTDEDTIPELIEAEAYKDCLEETGGWALIASDGPNVEDLKKVQSGPSEAS